MLTQTELKTGTPFVSGPWYDQTANGEYIRIRDEAGDMVLATVEDGGHVDPACSLDWEVMQANARLMASAPALLKALQAAIRTHGYGYSWGPEAAKAVEQALAK